MKAQQARFSIPSICAIVAAVASFNSGAFWGFMFAVFAVILGAVGLAIAFSPKVRGGLVSIIAVVGGVLGLVAAIIKGIAWLL